jgi:hypothetical protein
VVSIVLISNSLIVYVECFFHVYLSYFLGQRTWQINMKILIIRSGISFLLLNQVAYFLIVEF